MPDLSRREILAALAALTATGLALTPLSAQDDPLQAMEHRYGGRLGVFALDLATGRTLTHRADERFLWCSTMKLPLVAAVLARVDRGEERLDAPVHYMRQDLFPHSPVTEQHVAEGAMSVEELCAAAMTVSDNGAANLLLRRIGGPAALTRFVRSAGDAVSRFDRFELALNRPSGELDTTTPRAAVMLLKSLVLGTALGAASRRRLVEWLCATTVGVHRLRAGFPATWMVGDRTGTGDTETNDIAVAWPQGRAAERPILVAALYNQGEDSVSIDTREEAIRNIGSVIAGWAR
ncbi:class A beta-lactamase [Acidipila sp. EB88]|nr:class A beta-lactamase [Acidipila sp. EB88]